MIATMDDVQYNEHKLSEKAQRIIDIRSQLNEFEDMKKELHSEKPTCEKENLTYEESIEFGKRLNNYKEKIRKIEVKIQKLERQLTALELQAEKLIPVAGISIKVSQYSNENKPIKTFCILQAEDMSQSDAGNNIKIKKV